MATKVFFAKLKSTMTESKPDTDTSTPTVVDDAAPTLSSFLAPLNKGGTLWEPLPLRRPAPAFPWQGPGLRTKLLDL